MNRMSGRLPISERFSLFTLYSQDLRNLAFLEGNATRPVALLCRYTAKKRYIGFPQRGAFAIQ
jgi:hypothetical protein